jgi:hypothetical protein
MHNRTCRLVGMIAILNNMDAMESLPRFAGFECRTRR